MALLVALTLLTLGAALLVGTSAASRAAARAQISSEGAMRANAEARRALADVVSGWSGAYDSLSQGATTQSITAHDGWSIRIRVCRVADRRFVVVVDCQVGPEDAVIARRRLQLVLERQIPTDTTAAPTPPRPIGRWALSDIY